MKAKRVLDLFAGAGGFSVGAHALTCDVRGIELDADAVATQWAAGMTCEQANLTGLDPQDYCTGDHLHLHASPPCQTFSTAGKGEGRKHLAALSSAAVDIMLRGVTYIDLSDVPEGSLLVLEPARWIKALRPDSISMEQVRSVLPIWEAYAEGLEALGYDTWTALLCSEQYGVPQTRTRAWLGASLHGTVKPPAPTHSKYHARKPQRLDANVLPWVPMAEALGWGDDDLAGFPRRADNDDIVTIDGVNYRARDFRQGDQPAFGLTEKARSWTHLPATTVQGDSRIWPRGHKINQADIDRLGEEEAKARYGDRAGAKARRVTVEEAGTLQGFPADFPWQGSKTSQFRQVGNAVNPGVAEAVLRSVLSK